MTGVLGGAADIGKIQTTPQVILHPSWKPIPIVGIRKPIAIPVKDIDHLSYTPHPMIPHILTEGTALEDINQSTQGIHYVIIIPRLLHLILLWTHRLKGSCAIISKHNEVIIEKDIEVDLRRSRTPVLKFYNPDHSIAGKCLYGIPGSKLGPTITRRRLPLKVRSIDKAES
jgi:hypothetical protein